MEYELQRIKFHASKYDKVGIKNQKLTFNFEIIKKNFLKRLNIKSKIEAEGTTRICTHVRDSFLFYLLQHTQM